MFICDVSRSQPKLGPNKILNEVLSKDALKIEEVGIYIRARPAITFYLLLTKLGAFV